MNESAFTARTRSFRIADAFIELKTKIQCVLVRVALVRFQNFDPRPYPHIEWSERERESDFTRSSSFGRANRPRYDIQFVTLIKQARVIALCRITTGSLWRIAWR